MNILHINQTDIGGGASIAAYRLHQGLLQQEINSKLLVGEALTTDKNVKVIPQNLRLNNNLFRLNGRFGLYNINVLSTFGITEDRFYQEADIINLHNLHGASGWFNYLALPKIAANKPTVFTLHDMWSFTGRCAYSYDCDRWQLGCGSCPYLDIYPVAQRDSSAIEWQLKKWVYSKANLTIVVPSEWLARRAQASMLKHFPIHCIPYGIDTNAYQPLDSQLCRELLGITQQQNVLMCGVMSFRDRRKGGDLLVQALNTLPPVLKRKSLLLLLGRGGEEVAQKVDLKVLQLGFSEGDRLKAIAYSAADLFIFPTRADNLPLVLQESMACGTPMVSFAVGGVPDLVRPGMTGYLAPPENVDSFCQGILELLEDDQRREVMSQNCRAIALAEYSLELQAQRYIELYQSLLS
jgi:glycosyltransferase involved in cell wall biosynthesis